MKSHNNENKIREAVLAHNPYQQQANEAKDRVWNGIKIEEKTRFYAYWLKYAAIFLLALSLPLSMHIGYNLNNRNTIASSNTIPEHIVADLVNEKSNNEILVVAKNKGTAKTVKIAKYIADTLLQKKYILTTDSNKIKLPFGKTIENAIVENRNNTNDSTSSVKNKINKRIKMSDLLAEKNSENNKIVQYELSSMQDLAQRKQKKVKFSFGKKNKQIQTVRLVEIFAEL